MSWRVFGFVLLVAGCGAGDTTPPKLVAFTPNDGADLRGVGTMVVRVGVAEANGGTAYLDVDGTALPEQPITADCAEGCQLEWTAIDTTHVPVGPHVVHVRLVDAAGNTSERSNTVMFDDVLTIKSLQVTNTTDDVLPLEIEVYVFDDTTHTLLGCAGSRQGLGPVDYQNVHYTVDATLIDPLRHPMAALELGGGPIHFEVWEDDDPPVCPTVF